MGRIRKPLLLFTLFLCVLSLCACGKAGNTEQAGESASSQNDTVQESIPEGSSQQESSEAESTESDPGERIPSQEEPQTAQEEVSDMTDTDQIKAQIGDVEFTVTLEENESAHALKEMLADGAITISCSNYGGFEKVCRLGAALPSNDTQITTVAGDVMLYNSNQIVIFYGSNSWAYTRLGKVDVEYIDQLEEILSGDDTEITLGLNAE